MTALIAELTPGECYYGTNWLSKYTEARGVKDTQSSPPESVALFRPEMCGGSIATATLEPPSILLAGNVCLMETARANPCQLARKGL